MKRLLALGLTIGLLVLTSGLPAAPTPREQAKVKEALRELQDFIGGWKGSGSKKLNPSPRDTFWPETVKWNWRFKGDEAWLNVEFEGGKLFKSADIRYLLGKNKYELTATPVEGKEKPVFIGELKDDKLIFQRTDPETKEIQRIRMNTAAEGIRFLYYIERKAETGTIWRLEAFVQSTKIGESLAKKEKKGPECVVSGGLGTMTVSYMGEVFYVCCSGCLEAFKENPKKYVDEFKKNKK
ncbi:MAG: hypothetical protein U0840_27900 [Gemmataceae bacterium]